MGFQRPAGQNFTFYRGLAALSVHHSEMVRQRMTLSKASERGAATPAQQRRTLTNALPLSGSKRGAGRFGLTYSNKRGPLESGKIDAMRSTPINFDGNE